MAIRLMETLFGTKQEHDLKNLIPMLHTINEKENWAISLKDEDFPEETERLKEAYKSTESVSWRRC